jgi:phospholipid/cholesterol/gamma-HCH transport system permease protein
MLAATPSPGPTTTVERRGREAIVRVHGDLLVGTATALYDGLRRAGRARGVGALVVDFTDAARLDSSAVAVVAVVARQLAREGRAIALRGLDATQQAAFDLLPAVAAAAPEPPGPGVVERVGDRVLGVCAGARAFVRLTLETWRQLAQVVLRRERLPAGAVAQQLSAMGPEGLVIVGLINFLVGTTMAFLAVVQLERFGAGVYIADMVGLSVVREFAPLMTAVVLTGRTGAAIAAELGTMRVRSEVDALETMGINPVRFLILPRLLAITLAGPMLTLCAMAIGLLGGQLVASMTLQLPAAAFWARLAERLTVGDLLVGLGKGLAFSWVIGLSGGHFGLRAGGDASSVGTATTRTVVAGIAGIILVDSVWATITTLTSHS